MAKETIDVSKIVALIDEIDKAAVEKAQQNPQKINDIIKEVENAQRYVKQLGRFDKTQKNLNSRLEDTRRKLENMRKGVSSLHDTYILIRQTDKIIPILRKYSATCKSSRNVLDQVRNIDPGFVPNIDRLEKSIDNFLKIWRNFRPAIQTSDQFGSVLKNMYSAGQLSEVQRSIDEINSIVDNISRPSAQLITSYANQNHLNQTAIEDTIKIMEKARQEILNQGIKKILNDTKEEIADYERDYLRLNPK
jgi:archaellum component FlaC